MTSRIEQNDNQEDDLDWLARNVHEWKEGNDSVIMTSDKRIVEFVTADNMPAFYTGPIYTKTQWLTRRAELQNKPSWDDAPDCFNWMWQNADGGWKFGSGRAPELDNDFYLTDYHYIAGLDGTELHGEVLGDWRDTLEKRPDHIPDSGKMVDPLIDLVVSVKPTTYRPSMAELYPQYYKDVRAYDVMDVYAVHTVFPIDDPSGCIQHASKKLLLCGVRTGGKPAATEIKEARDTLTRKLQLMGEE